MSEKLDKSYTGTKRLGQLYRVEGTEIVGILKELWWSELSNEFRCILEIEHGNTYQTSEYRLVP